MKRIHFETITALVNYARAGTPHSPEDLAIHLQSQASRYFLGAQTLRHVAGELEDGLAKETMLANATDFETYARHIAAESLRLLGLDPFYRPDLPKEEEEPESGLEDTFVRVPKASEGSR